MFFLLQIMCHKLQPYCQQRKSLRNMLFAEQDGENDASLPGVLADICNNLWLLPSVCQGFVYDEFTGIASFLGQDKDQLIELSKQPQTCNRPGSSLWLLNAGMTTPTWVFSCCHSAEF